MAEDRLPLPVPDTQALRDERDRLQRIVEALAGIVALNLSTDALLERVLAFAIDTTAATGATVERIDGRHLEYIVAAGSLEAFVGLRLPIDTSLSGRCIVESELQYSADTDTDARVDRATCAQVGARSLLAVPLCHLGETIGVLKIVSSRPGAFDGIDRHALRLAAGLIAHAMGRQHVLDDNRQLSEERMIALSQASSVLAASPTATIVHDLDGIVRMWNPAAEALLGWSADEVIGQPMPVAYANAELFREITERIIRRGTAATEIVRRPRKDGSNVHVRVSGAAVRSDHGEVIGIVRTLEDVSSFRAHADSLKAAAERVRNIIEHSHDAFVSMDEAGRVIEWNRAAETLFGWTRQEALLRPLEDLVIPREMHEAHRAGLQRFLASGQSRLIGRRIEVMAVRRDGSQLPVELSINVTEVDGRPVFDSFLADISERRAEIDELRQQALLDLLTRLPGREYFQGQLRTALERNRETPQRIAVVTVNLDGFRAVNDLYGHATGDALLQEVARRLQASVREHDTVARLGGDEFAVVLEGLREARRDAPVVAGKMLAAFEEPVRVRTSALPVEASFGIALHEYAMDDAESLMYRAQEAMRAAKRAGGQRLEMRARDAGGDGEAV